MHNKFMIRWLKSALLEKVENREILTKIWHHSVDYVNVKQIADNTTVVALSPVIGRLYIFEIEDGRVSYRVGYHYTSHARTGRAVRLLDAEIYHITATVLLIQELLDKSIWKF